MMKIRALIFLLTLILLLPGSGLAQTTPEVETVEISQVDNSAYPDVTLYVRILDAAGNRVSNLTQDQFTVTEDGREVALVGFSAVNTTPIITFLVLDISGSMDEEDKLTGAKDAALTFTNLMRPQDQAALIVFDDTVSVRQPLTSDISLLQTEIRALVTGGRTAWYDAVFTAAQQLEGVSGRKSMLLLSDGLDNESYHTFTQAADTALASGAPVYAIGLGQAGNYDQMELTRIADQTGGTFFHTPSPSELESVYRTQAQATQDEYVLTYHSPRPDYDGTRRDIQVEVLGAGGSAAYVEQHLITIQSNLLVGVLFLFPLLMAVFVPLVGQYMYGVWRAGQQAAPPVQPTAPALPIPPVVRPLAPPAVSPPASPLRVSPGTQTCASCGRILGAGAQFCAGCGKPVAPPAPVAQPLCPHCHQPVRAGARFCGKCGRQI
jgi:VWFA-related protein